MSGTRSPGACSWGTTHPRRKPTCPATFPIRRTSETRCVDASVTRRTRACLAGGLQYDSGLPFEFDGDPATVLAQYGQQVLDRINFDRGRVDPAWQLNASSGATLHHTDRFDLKVQADGQNLNNILDVIDCGGLFSGNAIGPPRSGMLRLTTTF